MKRLPFIIICIVVALVAGGTGCDSMRRYDARLAAADSLMRSAPDSALAIVQAVDRDSLASEGDRAYRDLLLTQARYRCYITATSDSDINRALAWYRAHSGEREKLTRALIYKGAVMEELGHPDSAMLYYKQAEATADPDDYFNLGYVNIRIAELYQSLYINETATIARMKKATGYFTIVNDTNNLISTIGTQGALLYDIDSDSAEWYLLRAISFAEDIKSDKRFYYQSKLAGLYFYKKHDYMKAKNLAMAIVRDGKEECGENQFYYYAARSFIRLACLDSARYVSKMIPAPITPLDSINHFRLAAELADAEQRYQDHGVYLTKSKEISDRLYTKSLKSNVDNTEVKFDAEKLNKEYKKNIFNRFILGAVIAMFAILLMAFQVAKRILKRRIIAYQRDLAMARAEIEKTIGDYEARIAENESSLAKQRALLDEKDKKFKKVAKENDKLLSQQIEINGRISRIVRKRLAAINEIYQDIRVKTANNSPYKRSVPLISLIKDWNEKKQIYMITPKESFWKELQVSIDEEYHGLASFVKNKYPSLAIREFHLFLLLSAKISPQIIKLCLDFTNPTTVSNYKRKLMKNLTGHDMKLEDFIQDYLDGKLN